MRTGIGLCLLLALTACTGDSGGDGAPLTAKAMTCKTGEIYVHSRNGCTPITPVEGTHTDCQGDNRFLVEVGHRLACLSLDHMPHSEECTAAGVDHASCAYFTKLCQEATCRTATGDHDFSHWRTSCQLLAGLTCGEGEFPDVSAGFGEHDIFTVHADTFHDDGLALFGFSDIVRAVKKVGHAVTSTVTHLARVTWSDVRSGGAALNSAARAVAMAAKEGGSFVAKESAVVSSAMDKGVLFVKAEADKTWGFIEASACKIAVGTLVATTVGVLTSEQEVEAGVIVASIAAQVGKNAADAVIRAEVKRAAAPLAELLGISVGTVVGKASGHSNARQIVEELVFLAIEKAVITAIKNWANSGPIPPTSILTAVMVAELTHIICYGYEQFLARRDGTRSIVARLPQPDHGPDQFKVFLNNPTPPFHDLTGHVKSERLFTDACYQRHKTEIVELMTINAGIPPDRIYSASLDTIAHAYERVALSGSTGTLLCEAITQVSDSIGTSGVCSSDLSGDDLTRQLANREKALLAAGGCPDSLACVDGNCYGPSAAEKSCTDQDGLLFNGTCHHTGLKFRLQGEGKYRPGTNLAQDGRTGRIYTRDPSTNNTWWMISGDQGRCDPGTAFLTSWYRANNISWWDGYSVEAIGNAGHRDAIVIGGIWQNGYSCVAMEPCNKNSDWVKFRMYHFFDIHQKVSKDTGYYLARLENSGVFLDEDEERNCFSLIPRP